MNAAQDSAPEDEFAARLLAYDEALAEGRTPATVDDRRLQTQQRQPSGKGRARLVRGRFLATADMGRPYRLGQLCGLQ